MITISGLSKGFGGRVLFDGVSLQLNAQSRYGVVGANGSGKSTFVRILSGDDAASGGAVNMPKQARVGVLRQDRFGDDSERILDVAMRGDEETFAALAELALLAEQELPDARRQAELGELVARREGYALESRASRVLSGLGIPTEAQKQALSTLSGGFKLRVVLAQVLVGNPDIMLLDEPTNHLDILSIRWLEGFLAEFRGCLVLVSHDQEFLNRVCTHILDVDYETITPYTGNYDEFVRQRSATLEQKQREIARAERAIAEKRAFVERFGAKATKARQAQSRLKQIERIEVEELKPSSRREPHFAFSIVRQSGRDVLDVDALSKSYGPKQVLSNVSFQLRRGERLAIVGANGIGKSTLLQIAVGNKSADAGKAEWGHEARVGYFPQDHKELLTHPKQSALDFAWSACPDKPTGFVRGHLGRVLFSGDDVGKKVESLSGGEAARLIFAYLSIQEPNILVLDEPTNHLDLESIDALVKALQAYEGTLLVVSHNRWFVTRVATRVIELTRDGLSQFDSGYSDFVEKSGVDHLDRAAVAAAARQQARTEQGNSARAADAISGVSWDEQKRLRNRKKQLPQLRSEVMASIESAEARQRAIQALYCRPGFFEESPADRVQELKREEESLETRIAALMHEWETLEEEAARLEAL
jgi:ATPase subunit of ABC transporter with duplicated ATPase domains